jgi:hypothetical protein
VRGRIPSPSGSVENDDVVFVCRFVVEVHLEVLKGTKEFQVREKMLETLLILTPQSFVS